MKSTVNRDKIRELIDYAYLNLGDFSQYDLSGPFTDNVFSFEEDDEPPYQLLETMLNPRYLGWVCREILNITTPPFQTAILYELWTHSFPMLIGSRGLSKSYILSVYAILRCLLIPNSKVVIVGPTFRQSKFLFDYIVTIWRNAPILKDICGEGSEQGPHIQPDKCTMVIGSGEITCIPLSDGSKIRGLRSNCTIVDELAALPKIILENVVIGFGAVMSNPVENLRRIASIRMMEKLGVPTSQTIGDQQSNQLVLSGTAFYSFNHFYDYWMQYKNIILSGGDSRKLREIFKEGTPDNFNYKDYCVMRIPYELIPEGFMDSKQIDRAKATINSSTYLCEFAGCFATDSDGFFKRSLIELCTCRDDEPFKFASGHVYFSPMLKGNKSCKYVFGIDPASEKDKFSIAIIEIHPDHRRIVNIWTTERTHYKNLLKQGLTREDDFYGFCVRKIRDLMKDFPCTAIALDTQGGGIAIEEALHSAKHMENNEQAIWPVTLEDKEQDTDDKEGLHILHRINFANADWTREANHGMKFDFEQRILLFPAFDMISMGLAIEADKALGREIDTLEDCTLEIEELKNELSSIQHTQTVNGRDRWDTPETKLPGGKKGRQRKDRYSSLVMANMVGRQIAAIEPKKEYTTIGGFANQVNKDVSGPLMSGPEWYTNHYKANRQ